MRTCTCQHCGNTFEYQRLPGPGRNKRYCSDQCKTASNSKGGLRYRQRHRQYQYHYQRKDPASHISYEDCAICGRLFVVRTHAQKPNRCCSKECKQARKRECEQVRQAGAPPCVVADCDKLTTWAGMCKAHGMQRLRDQHPRPRKGRVCDQCGKAVTASRGGAADGKILCKQHRYEERQRQRHIDTHKRKLDKVATKLPVVYTGPPFQRKPRTKPNRTKPQRRFTSGRCQICTTWFTSPFGDVTCSATCQQLHSRNQHRLERDRRRAREKSAFVENVYRAKVYERDGYRCHLCGKKTRPDKQVPHPKAPTLDHVIPLASGGTHEPLNCRTACFICNVKKSDKGGGEQLLLIP